MNVSLQGRLHLLLRKFSPRTQSSNMSTGAHDFQLHGKVGRSLSRSGVPRGGGFKTPRNSEVLQSQTGLQIERKMFSVPIPTS
jgi:hypothetical protein